MASRSNLGGRLDMYVKYSIGEPEPYGRRNEQNVKSLIIAETDVSAAELRMYYAFMHYLIIIVPLTSERR